MKILLSCLALGLVPVTASAAAAAPPAKVSTFAPTRFSVVVEGKGPDVILIPGLASPREVWDGARAALGGRYRLHLLELNGFGGSDAGVNAEGGILPGTVAELSSYIAANKLKRPAIVGHSMGGFIGLSFAKAHPGQIGRLMIVDALPFAGMLFSPEATVESVTPQASAMRKSIAAQYGKPKPAGNGAASVPEAMVRTPENRQKLSGWSREADPRVVAHAMYETLTSDLRPDLASIGTPTTLLYPWDETAVPEARARALYEGAYASGRGIKTVPVPNSRHFIMLDQPELFANLLRAFLSDKQ